MDEERQDKMKKPSLAMLIAGGAIYAGSIPTIFWQTFEQKDNASVAYASIREDQKEFKREIREDLKDVLDSIEKKIDRLDDKVDRINKHMR